MRKFIGTVVILALVVAGIGYSRGWFGITTSEQPGATNIELKIDKEKIKQDAETVKEKARDITSQSEGDDDGSTGQSTDSAPN